jgi:GTP-binding protein
MLPVVSIVGRPNVGKSTLFNRLIGQRKAIVDDFYGVTRDRHYGQSNWNGRDFSVIDTGGYLPNEVGAIEAGTREQISIAIGESDLILFAVDVQAGTTSLDEALADLLLQQKTPVLLVANKADNSELELNAVEFYSLGFQELFAVSSVNGRRTGDLLDRVVEHFPQPEDIPEEEPPKLAIVGRPNVGKSSYVNALLNDNRCIVTDIPGTTRDSVNSRLTYEDHDYVLIDTAGLRKQKNIKENVEFYSTVRTERAIRACDVAILLVDAMQGFEHQDIHILKQAAGYNKGIIIALNKWDTVPEKDTNVFKEFEEYVYSRIPDMQWVPVIAISALTKKRIYRVLNVADKVIEEREKKISTSSFNKFLQSTLKKRPLPMKRGKALKIKYGLQVKTNPPVFKFFMNMPSELPSNYRRFLEREIRQNYDFTGVPITMVFRQK